MKTLGLLLLLVALPAAQASLITFSTPVGSKDSLGDPVNATATFSITSANTLVITLTNLQANPLDVGQNLSDLAFNLSTGQTVGTLTSSLPNALRTIAGTGGTYGDVAGTTTNWALQSTTLLGGLTVPGLRLCDLCAGGGAPADTIVGPPNGSGLYAAANSSIAGNGPHNPFIGQSATFTLTITGITSNTTVTNAIFSFGTTEGDNVPGGGVPPSSIPEPASLLLIGGGLVLLGSMRRILRTRS